MKKPQPDDCLNLFATSINQRGFSLVQVMIAFGLMGGLAVMMMRLMDNQNKQAKSIELKSEQQEIKNIILKTLDDKTACEATFLGMSPGDDIKQIRLSSDFSLAPFAETGVKFKSYNVYIKRMYLLTRQEEQAMAQSSGTSFVPPAPPDGYGSATLRVTFVKNIGQVTDSNKSHQFYGSKETAVDIQVQGYFYDREVIKAYPPNITDLYDACKERAQTSGVNCATPSGTCSIWNFKAGKKIEIEDDMDDKILDSGSNLNFAVADCHFIRQNSPFMACHTLAK
jgi:hypothetical protein